MDYAAEFWTGRSTSGYRCADCGRSRQEAQQIDVHHIDPDGADHPDNLVGLCRRCHLEARHRRDGTPGDGALAPDTPTATAPDQPTSGGLSPGF